MVTRGSRLASIRLRLYSFARRTTSSASFRAVMSRAMVDAPTTRPSRFRIGESVNEIWMWLPSFRIRPVS